MAPAESVCGCKIMGPDFCYYLQFFRFFPSTIRSYIPIIDPLIVVHRIVQNDESI